MLIKNFLSNQTDLSVLSQTKDHLFIKNYLQAFDAPFYSMNHTYTLLELLIVALIEKHFI